MSDSLRAARRFDNALRYRPAIHESQTQLTPPYVLDPVRADLNGIELDPCTMSDNPCGAERWYTIHDDGLIQPWDARSVFVNPPYGKAREPWLRRCTLAASRGSAVVLLIPAHTDTHVFQSGFRDCDEAVFVQGRVKFGIPRDNGRQRAASHPSVLLAWNCTLAACFSLGVRAVDTDDSGYWT